MDPVKLVKYSWQFLFGESITEEVDRYPAAQPYWDETMETLGDWSNYGNPKEYTFNYDPMDR